MERIDERAADQIRPVKITRNYIKYAEGSCFFELGDTKVICTASVDERVPAFLKGSETGWITAEYGMLPRACETRNIRDVVKGSPSGRSQEIQRIIGRALRAVVDLRQLGERTVWLDCDVIQADGGTRSAAVTGAFVALIEALNLMKQRNIIKTMPVYDFLACVSVGIVSDENILDLCYHEDQMASVDLNIAMTGKGKLVEIQGTAEGMPFTVERLNALIELARKGIDELVRHQREALKDIMPNV